ncbi:unnamed protein product [Protopolystoma xenopodis]|uniref:Secreted protein n=1 Tax=Protopolystoma xenopodis TaxID=117903 RepID=A0A3S5A4E7_9PLAT|nr:unnamed protein product [Protopolystoma xenopodis]
MFSRQLVKGSTSLVSLTSCSVVLGVALLADDAGESSTCSTHDCPAAMHLNCLPPRLCCLEASILPGPSSIAATGVTVSTARVGQVTESCTPASPTAAGLASLVGGSPRQFSQFPAGLIDLAERLTQAKHLPLCKVCHAYFIC